MTTNEGTPSFVMITPVQQADADAGEEREHQRRASGEHVVVVGEGQQGDEHARHAADEADRQVDLPQQQHEDDPHADGREGGRLDDEVDEVAGGEEVRVLRLEDDRDDDQPDDDRQRAELAGP